MNFVNPTRRLISILIRSYIEQYRRNSFTALARQ